MIIIYHRTRTVNTHRVISTIYNKNNDHNKYKQMKLRLRLINNQELYVSAHEKCSNHEKYYIYD